MSDGSAPGHLDPPGAQIKTKLAVWSRSRASFCHRLARGIREKFTKERSAARKAIREYYKRFPNKRYQTELESWRHLQSQNFEFVMKRLPEPIANPRLI